MKGLNHAYVNLTDFISSVLVSAFFKSLQGPMVGESVAVQCSQSDISVIVF